MLPGSIELNGEYRTTAQFFVDLFQVSLIHFDGVSWLDVSVVGRENQNKGKTFGLNPHLFPKQSDFSPSSCRPVSLQRTH